MKYASTGATLNSAHVRSRRFVWLVSCMLVLGSLIANCGQPKVASVRGLCPSDPRTGSASREEKNGPTHIFERISYATNNIKIIGELKCNEWVEVKGRSRGGRLLIDAPGRPGEQGWVFAWAGPRESMPFDRNITSGNVSVSEPSSIGWVDCAACLDRVPIIVQDPKDTSGTPDLEANVQVRSLGCLFYPYIKNVGDAAAPPEIELTILASGQYTETVLLEAWLEPGEGFSSFRSTYRMRTAKEGGNNIPIFKLIVDPNNVIKEANEQNNIDTDSPRSYTCEGS